MQAAYAGFTHCLQAEWQYLLHCVPDVSPHLTPIETVIHSELIPVLLGSMPERLSRVDFHRLLSNSVRCGGMAIRNPMMSGPRAHMFSVQAVKVLTASLLAGGALDAVAHRRQMWGAA